MSNPIGWVEIPVLDMARAITFYNNVFDWNLESQPFGDYEIAMFPSNADAPGSSGALACNPNFYKPSETDGPLVYFTTTDVVVTSEKAERAGGRIIVPVTPIPPFGAMAVAIDVEGNRIAFHQP